MLPVLVNSFIADVCAGKSNETPRAYRTKLNYLIRLMGEDAPLDQPMIDTFRARLLGRVSEKTLSPFTARSVITTVRHFVRWIVERKLCQRLELKNIKEPPVIPKMVEADVIAKIIDAIPNVGQPWEQARNLALVYMLRDTGGRAGCIAGVELGHVDLVNGLAEAPDKGGQMTWLFLSDPTITAIRAWMRVRSELLPTDDRLFVGRYGKGINRQTVQQVLQRLAKAAGVQGKRHNPHAWRHAFARDMLMSGVDISLVSPMMGHKGSVVTAKYYGRFAIKELKRMHKKHSPGKRLPKIE
jgi:integrase/recombinase XerD